MKKILTLAVLATLLVAPMTSFAQGAGPKGGAPGKDQGPRQGGFGRMGKMNEEIMAKLNLTKAQQTKIDALNAKYKAQMEAMRKDMKPGSDRKAMMEKARSMMETRKAEFEKILTAAQLKKYEELMKAAREKMRKEFGGGAGDKAAGKDGKGGKGGKGGGGL